MRRTALEKLLRPRSIALIGASEREHSAGLRILRNIVQGGFTGAIYPINPRYKEIQCLRCYEALSALPEIPDVVFVAIGAEDGLAIIEEAGKLGVRAIMTNATGFADAGEEGAERQKRLVALASKYGIVVCGPNNSGFMNLWDNVYISTFYQLPRPNPGPVALISQSGQVSCALGQDDREIGLGYNITTGTEAILNVVDYGEFVLQDERIQTVMFFLETIRDPVRFAAMAQDAIKRGKNIIATKVGRSEAGRAVAAAHSGALVGDDAVYDAFFRKNSIIRAADLDEMIELALLFKGHSPSQKHDIVFMSISGGMNGLISDIATDVGLTIPALKAVTAEKLRPFLSPYLTPQNPLDIMGLGWDKERIANIIRVLADDKDVGTIAIEVDASGSGVAGVKLATDLADVCVSSNFAETQIVFFTSTAGGGPNREIDARLRDARVPFLCGMRPSVGALARWAVRGSCINETPTTSQIDLGLADQILKVDEARRFDLLREAGVPMVRCLTANDAASACRAAEVLGYPVVLKGTAPDLLHKTELGLLRLNLMTPVDVREAYGELVDRLRENSSSTGAAVVVQPMLSEGIELIAAVRKEIGFGDVVVVGLGGTFVELLAESALRIGPITKEEARVMLSETRAAKILDGYRGKGPYDLDAAVNAIVALSNLSQKLGNKISAIEINPLIILERGQGAAGVDVAIEPSTASDIER